jgi:hypothetical protein
MNTKYIIRAYEEELGDEYLVVTVPEGVNEETVYKNFRMASKYAWVSYDDEASDYDEHFEDMCEYKESTNGLETAMYYLARYCGYRVKFLHCDYEFEW